MSNERNVLLVTAAGNTLCNPEALIRVSLDDGSYADVRAREAGRYAGCHTLFEKTFIDRDPKELEERLMQATEGPQACFRIARERLFQPMAEDAPEDEPERTVFNHIMARCYADSASGKTAFCREVLGYVESGAEELGQGVKPVKLSSVKSWINSPDRLGPDDWRHFYSLSRMGGDAAKFRLFYDDFLQYRAWQANPSQGERPPISSNIYSAYLTYCIGRQLFGMRGRRTTQKKGGKKSAASSGRQTGTYADAQAMKAEIQAIFCDDVTDYIVRVPILRVQTLNGKEKGNGDGRKQSARNHLRRGVVFMTDETMAEVQERAPAKPLSEICKEIAIIERAVICYSRAYATERETQGREPDQMGKARTNEHLYLVKLMEAGLVDSRIRHRPEDDATIVAQHIRGASRLRELSQRLVAELLRMPTKDPEILAFRSLHKAYTHLYPAYPPMLDRLQDIQDELRAISKYNPKKRGDQRKKEKRKKYLEGQYKELEIQGWVAKAEQCYKHLASERLEKSWQIGIEKFDAITPERAMLQVGLALDMDSFRKLRESFYSPDEIKEVLARYGGEALIDSNLDILLMKKLLMFFPGANPIKTVIGSDDIVSRILGTDPFQGRDFTI